MGKQQQIERIIHIAAEVAAKTALDYFEQKYEERRKEVSDSRLRNTKLLLKNYRLFKAYVENSVFEKSFENPLDILEDLMSVSRSTISVDSIKQSAARTAVIVEHMEKMLEVYHAYCSTYCADENLRKWQVINDLYLVEKPKTVLELSNELGVVGRMIYKYADSACEIIGVLMFGVDGIRKRRGNEN